MSQLVLRIPAVCRDASSETWNSTENLNEATIQGSNDVFSFIYPHDCFIDVVFSLAAAAQKPPAGAGIPIPTVSIGTDGIKINFPKPPAGPGVRLGGPTTTADPPALHPSDEIELEAFRHALAAQAMPAQVSAYLSLVKSTRAVVGKFEDLRTLLDRESASTERPAKNGFG